MSWPEHSTDEFDALSGRVRAELTRLRAERDVAATEQRRLANRLDEAEERLRGFGLGEGAPVDDVRSRLQRAQARASELDARGEALAADVTTTRQERDALRAELRLCRQERDSLRLRLLDAEVVLAAGGTEGNGTGDEAARAAERDAGEVAKELAATRRTLSWRITRPLRAVRRRMGPRS